MFKLIRNIYSFSQQIDYSQIAKQIQNATIENNQFALAVQKIQGDMKEVVQKAYLLPRVEKVLKNIRSSHLCQAAVEQYVGSMYSPRNEQIAQLFLTYARQNAQSQQEVLEYKFYFYYLRKLEALQRGNQQEFDKVNSELIQLAGQGSLQAMHLIAKEMYKVAMNMMSGKQKKEKEKMLKEAYDLYNYSLQRFMTCAQKEFPHSFYYIGEMAERGDIQGGIDLVFALECYTIAASFDNPSAFFKLAQLFHKDGVVCKKDPALEFYYTKKAAEMGLLDAQHNLAVMYREGRIVPKDEIKALAWFTNAGNHGYPQSMYNAGMMFHEGGEKFKKNKKAALVWYEKVQQTGVINVQRLIDQLVQELDQ